MLYHIIHQWHLVALYIEIQNIWFEVILFHCLSSSRSFSATSPSPYRCQNFVPRIVFPFILLKSGIAEPQSELHWTFTHEERVQFVHTFGFVGFDGLGYCNNSWRSLYLFFLFREKVKPFSETGPYGLTAVGWRMVPSVRNSTLVHNFDVSLCFGACHQHMVLTEIISKTCI